MIKCCDRCKHYYYAGADYYSSDKCVVDSKIIYNHVCGNKHYDYTRSCDANEKLDCERWTPRNWWVRYLLKRNEKNILGKT